MNVLVMANFRADCSGNFINSLLALADKAKKEHHGTVFMFPLRDDGSECNWVEYIKSYGYEVILYPYAYSPEELTQELFSIIDKYKIDLIHSHFSCLENVLLWNRQLHSKVKILFHDHMDYIAETPVWPQLKKQIKLAKRYKSYGIGVISVMKKKGRGYFLTPKRWYVPNGITYKRNVERSMTREECREIIGIKDGQKLCLFLGWDIYRKGLDVAIKAVLKIREKNPDVFLGVLGFGSAPNEELIEKIKKVVGFDPRQEGILFLDAWEDMYAMHRATDVYVSASRTEAFAYGILEAISQNVPVVVSNITGTKWALKYSKSVKFPSENVDKCAEAILQVINRRDEPSNKDVLTEKYNIDIWCDRVLSVYKKMMEK